MTDTLSPSGNSSWFAKQLDKNGLCLDVGFFYIVVTWYEFWTVSPSNHQTWAELFWSICLLDFLFYTEFLIYFFLHYELFSP